MTAALSGFTGRQRHKNITFRLVLHFVKLSKSYDLSRPVQIMSLKSCIKLGIRFSRHPTRYFDGLGSHLFKQSRVRRSRVMKILVYWRVNNMVELTGLPPPNYIICSLAFHR
jgi:hypothetical protein